MKKHQKTWSVTEKLEILDYSKKNGVVSACREYDVSSSTIYRWREKYDMDGESGLKGTSTKSSSNAESAELRRLMRENTELKKLVAEKELAIRIKDAMLKKNR